MQQLCFANDIKEGDDVNPFYVHNYAADPPVIMTNICFTNIDGSVVHGIKCTVSMPSQHTTMHVLKFMKPDYEIGIELIDVSDRYATLRIIDSGEIISTWTNTIFKSKTYNSRLYLNKASATNLEATVLYRRCNCSTNLCNVKEERRNKGTGRGIGVLSGHSTNESGALGSRPTNER